MLATCIISGATQRRLKFPAVPFCAQETETVLEPNVRAQHGDTAADGAESEHGIGFMVAINKSGDFTSEAASKRLALLLSLTEMPSGELSERELLMYLDHYLPQESDLSRCAVGGLLSHMQRSEARLSVLALRRHPLKQTVHVSPETLLSLNVFEDRAHPSAHGGRAREGFSLWQLMNKTRSKPGERLLRSWFARPSRDPELLHERLATVELFSHGLDSALPQLHSLIARVKDVCKLQRSFDRGGLLLCDYTNALSTATCAVKMRELLESAEVPTELAIMRRVVATIGIEHTQLANMLLEVPTLIEHRSTMVCSMQVMIQEKDEDDDSLHTVVFLYRVALGRSPESFGWHCAVQAQMPAEIVQRARHISRCQIEGVPILPIGSDDPTQDKERLQRELVDAFLAFDLDNASSLTFFAENEAKLQTLSACRTAA